MTSYVLAIDQGEELFLAEGASVLVDAPMAGTSKAVVASIESALAAKN